MAHFLTNQKFSNAKKQYVSYNHIFIYNFFIIVFRDNFLEW